VIPTLRCEEVEAACGFNDTRSGRSLSGRGCGRSLW
jgi:hypothetical protein